MLALAGARPTDRDSVDQRLIADAQEPLVTDAKIIDSQDEVGGWPELAENEQPYVDPDEPDSIPETDPYSGIANPGYTLRELYLHHLARLVECGP